VIDQLSLLNPFAPVESRNGLEAVRRLVAEDDMSTAEIEALVEDAVAHLGGKLPERPGRAQPCRYTRTLVLSPGTCVWCGRAP
jgi:hypothetical protein